jgi:RNA polymerase sigma factor (sigma-70 family)
MLQHIRRMVEDERTKGLSDQELLAHFAHHGDEAAFQALVRRHGPMALDVCRAVVVNEADTEDAFQAAFLVLARKARSIRKTASLASWLHGVAYRIALDARRRSATRSKHETNVPAQTASAPDDLTWREAQRILHEELGNLAERHRAPLVTCYLQGKTQDEAAAVLGMSKGTLKSRLEQGRELLRTRLIRRGLGPASVAFAAAWPAAAWPAAAWPAASASVVPVALIDSTAKAASILAAGQTAPVSATVVALTAGGLNAMPTSKLKTLLAVVLLLGLLATGATVFSPGTAAVPLPKSAPAKPVVVREDAVLQHMAMSPDGGIVATVGIVYDGSNHNSTVKLWDARTLELRATLDEEKDSHLGIAFSRDFLAIAVNRTANGKRREVRLLDAKTLALKHALDDTHVPDVRGWGPLAFSPDGKRLAVAGTALAGVARESVPFLRLWDGQKQRFIEGKPDLGEIPRDVVYEGITETNGVDRLAFSPDGKLLATAWRDAKIRLFDGQTGDFRTLLDTELKHGARIGGIAFSPDSRAFAFSGDNGVVLWDVTAAKPRLTLKTHKGHAGPVAFSKDERWIATAGRSANEGESYEVALWDAKTGEVKQTLPGLNEWIQAIAFAPDGKSLVVSGGSHAPEGKTYKSSGALWLLPLPIDQRTGAEASVALKPRQQAPAPEKESFTAWGKEIGSLQAGLGFRPGESRAYRHGETVTIVLRLRNVGKEAIDFKHIWAFFVENPPTVTDADGKPVRLPRSLAEGLQQPRSTKVPPGKEVELYEWRIDLRPQGESSRNATIHGTGRFSLQRERIVGPTSGNPIHPNPALNKLGTGKLDLEVKAGPPPHVHQPMEDGGYFPGPPGSPPVSWAKQEETEKANLTAWGKEVDGLQAGLGYHPGEKRAYHHGETVRLVLRIRNVSNNKVRVDYHTVFLGEISPAVTDAQGKAISLAWPTMPGAPRGLGQKNLAPGQEIEFHELRLELKPASEQANKMLRTLYGTGTFHVHYKQVDATPSGAGVFFHNPLLSKLATGKLELEVKSGPLADSGKLPPGWGGGGTGYEVTVDRTAKHGGQASGSIKSTATNPDWYAALTQAFKADEFRGKRLRLTAYLKSKDVESSAALWMRIESIDGNGRYCLSLDHMGDRPIKGTSDWRQYEVILDVPQDPAQITFGALLAGKGQLWVDDFRFEAVNQTVKTTGQVREPARNNYALPKSLPKQPRNVDFEE